MTILAVLNRLRPTWWVVGFAILCAVAYQTQIRREMADFHVYRTAAARALQAEPLYQAADGHYQFKYLPAFALAMTPFARLDTEPAKAVWFALSALLLIVFVGGSVRALPNRRRAVTTVRWLTVLLTIKFYAHELTLGQTNVLLGVLLIGGLMAIQSGRPRLAGVLIGLAAFVKPYALILLPWLLVSSGTAAALASAAVIAAGLLLPAAVYGWAGNLDLLAGWFRTVTESTSGNLLGADNVSIAAMWAKWIGAGAPATALAAATVVAVLALAVAVWWGRRRVASPDYLEYALLMLLVPLVSPQGWDYVLLLGTPAVACLVDRWPALTRTWRLVTGASLVLMGLTIFDVMGRALYGRFMALSIVTVAALGVALALAHLRRAALA
jgi:hypothetical protein